MIEFNRFDDYNFLVYKDNIHIAIIRNSIYGIHLISNNSIELGIDEINAIHHYMKWISHTKFILLLNEKLKNRFIVQYDYTFEYFIISNTTNDSEQNIFFRSIDNLLKFIKNDLKIFLDESWNDAVYDLK